MTWLCCVSERIPAAVLEETGVEANDRRTIPYVIPARQSRIGPRQATTSVVVVWSSWGVLPSDIGSSGIIFSPSVTMRATTLLGLSFLLSPWLTLSQSTPQYGYNGPGVYRIVSLSSSLPIGYNTSTDTKDKPIISV